MCKIHLRPNLHETDDGFALIEVLISISLFSIAFMALTAAIWTAGQRTRATDFADQTIMAGQESIEMLTAIPIDNADLDGNTYKIDRNDAILQLEWEAFNGVDSDGDGVDDFKTILMSAYSQGELKMQVYYRRQIN